ncbi:MAG: radical SAM protein [Acidimicrobiales bacterium]
MRALVVAAFELGRQSFAVASAVAALRGAGAEVDQLDLSLDPLTPEAVRGVDLVAFHLPMHTAARLAVAAAERARELRPGIALCFFGLYAPLNGALLRRRFDAVVLGPEFEAGLAELAELRAGRRSADGGLPRGRRRPLAAPDRRGAPGLDRYAKLRVEGAERLVGAAQASRGCRHRCRHCPEPLLYDGRIRLVPAAVVAADVAQLVEAGAGHVSLCDPDFLNAPRHALAVLEALHRAHPDLTFDVTVRVEHLVRHEHLLGHLRDLGVLIVTTAAESADDQVLALLDKGHTMDEFRQAARACAAAGLTLNPTFMPFSPWTTALSLAALVRLVAELDLVEHVAPVQYTVRLLLPAGSVLAGPAAEVAEVGCFDEELLGFPWRHGDPGIDELHRAATTLVGAAVDAGAPRRQVFRDLAELFGAPLDQAPAARDELTPASSVAQLTEPWFC